MLGDLAVATRPLDKNGLGLTQAAAVANVRVLRARTSLLAEDSRVADRLLELMDEIPCGGRQVHDANVVATMLVHGIDPLITITCSGQADQGSMVVVVSAEGFHGGRAGAGPLRHGAAGRAPGGVPV